MKKEAAEFIVNDLFVGNIRDDYSGRCMYGKITHGVVVDDISDVTYALESHIKDADDKEAAIEDLVKLELIEEADCDSKSDFQIDGIYWDVNFRRDNMGRSYIIY